MDASDIATTVGLPEATIKRLMGLAPADLLQDPEYLDLLHELDRELLEETLPMARSAYEEGLPAFSASLNARYGLADTPMSAYTLGNWVVGALQYPDHTSQILKMHDRVPGEAVRNGLEDLLGMLSTMPKGSREWQRALCALSLPLMA